MVKNNAAAAVKETTPAEKNTQVAPQVETKGDTKAAAPATTKEQPKAQDKAPEAANETVKPSEAQPLMDLAKDLSSNGLREMRGWIDSVLKDREAGELAKAREQIKAIAESVGVPLAELLGIKGGGKPTQLSLKMPSTVPVKYRHPTDDKLTWTGRGRSPQWVKEWLEAHAGDDSGIKA